MQQLQTAPATVQFEFPLIVEGELPLFPGTLTAHRGRLQFIPAEEDRVLERGHPSAVQFPQQVRCAEVAS